MQSIAPSFAHVYKYLLQTKIRTGSKIRTSSTELINYTFVFNPKIISIYSEKTSKAFPITFALAELCWILSGSNQTHQMLKPLDKYATNNGMIGNYNTNILTGAYGARLHRQIPVAIHKLIADPDTRQCVLSIYSSSDLLSPHKDIPCTTQLQFFIRKQQLHMIITSRSSDILTKLPIDAFQWQCLYHLILNELNETFNPHLTSGNIYYNIGSLYMQSTDISMYKQFIYTNNLKKFEHNISIYQTYTNARDRAITKFPTAKKIEHLLEIVDIGSFTQINKLISIFNHSIIIP
jgi:thymidylate synthase